MAKAAKAKKGKPATKSIDDQQDEFDRRRLKRQLKLRREVSRLSFAVTRARQKADADLAALYRYLEPYYERELGQPAGATLSVAGNEPE